MWRFWIVFPKTVQKKSKENFNIYEEKSREKRRGEAEKDESQGKKKKKMREKSFMTLGQCIGHSFFSFLVENIIG